MRADLGDKLIVNGLHVGEQDRQGVIIEIHGQHGAPPYLVRWQNGHESLFFPSTGTSVEHHPAESGRAG